jgi:hypothetical protein
LIDADLTCLHASSDAAATLYVASEDVRTEAIGRIVCEPHSLLL